MRAAGCSFLPFERAPHRTTLDPSADPTKDWEASNPLEMLGRVRDEMLVGPAGGQAADTRAAIAEVRPHAVLPEMTLFGAVIGAQAEGVPVAPIVPNVWVIPTQGVPAIGPGLPLARSVLGRVRDRLLLAVTDRLFAKGLPTLNTARAEHGLEPLTSLYDQVLGTDRVFVLTSPTFDFSSAFVPDNVTYLGPVLDDPTWADAWQSPWPDDDARPLVLVGFSSTFQDQAPVLQRVVDALASLPVRAVVTLGQQLDEGTVTGTDNVAVVASAPHGQLLEEAALTISHCGHGTTLKTLAAGRPMVCLPMGRDQNDTAARVVHAGAGTRLRPTASSRRIRTAVTEVLDDPAYARAARSLARDIAAEQEDVDLVAELEGLATSTAGQDRAA